MKSINFLPSSFFDAARRRRRRAWELAVVGVAIIAMAGGYLLLSKEAKRAAADLAAMSSAAPGPSVDPQLKKQMQGRKQAVSDKLATYRQLASSVSVSQVLAAISELQDPSIGLTELVGDGKRPTPRPKVDPAAEAKKKSSARRAAAAQVEQVDDLGIVITGFGPDDAAVTDYVGRLSRHPLFTDVKLEFSRPIEVGDYLARGFTITAKVSLDCEYRAPEFKEVMTDAD